ncbi:MAG: sigma-54-dependent transcriptional regulator [Halocynthiibacter sp.]
MNPPLLLIEDTPSLQMVYEAVLRNAGYEVRTEGTAAGGLERFLEIKPNVVLLDLMLPDRDGLELIKDCLAAHPETRIIVITANGSISRAVEAMRAGAFEFLLKPFSEERFLHAIENADAEVRSAETPAVAPTEPDGLAQGFIGSSEVMNHVYGKIRTVANSMATVFITGESGTGKEICAQAVHQLSDRATGPFIPLNCGAIPADLLESEVFGHLRGSFTGAIADKPGAAAAADGGTLFLDEICEMDLNLQTKLLRFLQTSMISPVGSVRPHKVNVRIICATNRNPTEMVRQGAFRQDLFYRLHVVPINLPPLRERGEDVIELAESALLEFSREEGRDFGQLSDEVKSLFRDLSWPGNVRQLMNAIRNVVVLNNGNTVTRQMLPIDIFDETGQQWEIAPDEKGEQVATNSLAKFAGMTLAQIEQLVIEEAIARNGGSVPKAALVLDVSPSTLYRKIAGWNAKKP